MNHPLFQLFKEKGELLSAPSNTLLSCQREKETLWFLEKGSVNLFAIELQNGSPEGVRTFLSHLLSPILFFPRELDPPYGTLCRKARQREARPLFNILSRALLRRKQKLQRKKSARHR